MRLIGTIRRARPSAVTLTILLLPAFLVQGEPLSKVPLEGSPAHVGQERVPDPLAALNVTFREAYSRCRLDIINRSGPVILIESDDVILIRDGKRLEARMVPEVFHVLKAVSHVPLAVYVMLVQFDASPLSKEVLEGLQSYRQRVSQLEPALKDRGLTEAAMLRNQEIIRASVAFLDSVLEKKQVSHEELSKYTREAGPKLLASAADAAQFELDGLDKQINVWRSMLSDAEWRNLHVVIMGSAMPRRGNLAVQYFSQLLGEKGEGKRIVYAEALFDEKRALNLLGTHLLDTRIGVDFFDDPARMHRDLLADAATEYLKKMPAKP